jgi:ribosome-binding ATPase YchF (GTP1/OBG family)
LIVVNVAEDDTDPAAYRPHVPMETPYFVVPLDLERELARMEHDECQAFCEEMGVAPTNRDEIIRTMLDSSGQMLFFTAGDKEVRTWMIHKGGTALEAAGGIHTDLARGFIRAETMQVGDLVRLGSEREVKAHNLMRAEPKDYVIQDGDILLIRHN